MKKLIFSLCLSSIFTTGCGVKNLDDDLTDNQPLRDNIYSQIEKNGVVYFAYVPQFEAIGD